MISYMVWYGCCCGFLVGVLWRRSYLYSLHLEVCVEGQDIGYDMHGFLFALGYLLRCLVSLILDLILIRDCDH